MDFNQERLFKRRIGFSCHLAIVAPVDHFRDNSLKKGSEAAIPGEKFVPFLLSYAFEYPFGDIFGAYKILFIARGVTLFRSIGCQCMFSYFRCRKARSNYHHMQALFQVLDPYSLEQAMNCEF